MTELLDQAFLEAGKLSEEEQNRLAQWLLDELASERRWGEFLTSSPDTLKSLADEALAEHRDGRTHPVVPADT